MKVKNKIYKLLGILFLSIFITSCADTNNEIIEDSISKINIEKAPLNVQIDYANKHLLEIGKVLSKLSHNKEFKSVLYKNENSKFDKNYYKTILVKDLIKDLKIDNVVNNSINHLEESDKLVLKKSLEAFYDIDGQDWYPEVVIVNYSNKYNKYKSTNNKSSETTPPIIVPVVYEDTDEATEDAYDAYQEDGSGELVPLGYTVTQSDAETKDILFLKIDESCELQGVNGICPESIEPGGGGGGTVSNPKFYFDRMTVKKHYESVGASEVEVKTQGYYVTGHYPISKIKISNTNRNVQYYYSRRNIRKKQSRYINSRYIYADPIPNTGEIYYAVMIFEYDAWPAPKETKFIRKTLDNGEVLKIPFDVRSWQGPYNDEIKEGIPSWTFENSSIKYNFLYKYY